ncbi:hypothetical protein N8797_01475, partial [Pontimonas sp.]|nr:hypothetical protein [Pontimonas sp.]
MAFFMDIWVPIGLSALATLSIALVVLFGVWLFVRIVGRRIEWLQPGYRAIRPRLRFFILTVALHFSFQVDDVALIALGALLMGSVPAGTTSNIFTYFSKGNLALSVIMTANSTLWAIVMTPLVIWIYGRALFPAGSDVEIPTRNIVLTLVILLIPVVCGMLIRRYSANIGAILELMGGFFGLFFIVFLLATWVPRNWELLTNTTWQTYMVAIGLGLFGITLAYIFAKALRLHPM